MEMRTPERDRQAERQRVRDLQQLQMTSPRVRRQRALDRQPLIEQPLFDGTSLSQRPPEYVGHVPLPGWTLPTVTAAPLPLDCQETVFSVNDGVSNIVRHRHLPVPVQAYPGLPRHAIAHHDRQAAYREQLNIHHPPAQTTHSTRRRRARNPVNVPNLNVNMFQVVVQPDVPIAPQQPAARPDPGQRIQLAPQLQGNHEILKACQPYTEPTTRYLIGSMNIECSNCHALHWRGEKLVNSSNVNPAFGICCLQGQISLPPLQPPPRTLDNLLCGSNTQARSFREKIRQYNCAFAFTSVAVNIDNALLNRAGPYCFRIHGELHHLMGSLEPDHDPNEGTYAQLYIYDPAAAIDVRNRRNPNLDPMIMLDIQTMLLDVNPFVPLYKQAYQLIQEKPVHEQLNIEVCIAMQPGRDQRVYNLPTVNEVAAIIPRAGEAVTSQHRNIVVRLRGGNLRRISNLHPLYSPLHYVLLFPCGEPGWHPTIPLAEGHEGRGRSKNVSQRCFYAYRLFPRFNEPETLFRGGRLLQQYMVDAWASCEANELYWIRTNQKDIRADLYQGLRDAVDNADGNINLAQHGQRIILPSSHTGSPRHMYQLFQDSLAISRYCQKPDLFVTMTANPNWPEVQEALLALRGQADDHQPKQTASDRPDIVVRVFYQKLKELLKDIKSGAFGEISGFVYTVEFQKRGLPHAHILIFLKERYKIKDAEHVDKIVSAQLPDPVAHPMLYETVTKYMLHGPCGRAFPSAPCMVDGKCSKKYPRQFCETTLFGEDGYPIYARPNNGRTYTKTQDRTYNNCSVVPHNPYLSVKYNCHINVEICASIKAIKYIHKYIYKGPDQATLEIGDIRDEIKEFVDARYIGPHEAVWRLLELPMHEEWPHVYRLPVHLKDEQQVYFNPNDVADNVLQRDASKKTQLTEWFKANTDFRVARDCFYQDFPQKFVWNKSKKGWTPRKKDFAIGRMMAVHPSSGERFYLRLLLTVVKGAKEWKDLRMFNGVEYPTYKEACRARGMLEDDGEWDQCLLEAGELQTGYQLRALFACILLHCQPTQPEILWQNHRERICDDLRHRLTARNITNPTNDQVFDYGLHLLEGVLLKAGKRLSDFPPMPLPQGQWIMDGQNPILQAHLDYNRYELQLEVQDRLATFNPEQRAVYDAVMGSVDNNRGQLFFLQSAGGGGKTWVCATIAHTVRSHGHVALCVSSSGISALILPGGRTSHSQFKIPIPVLDNSTCNIKRGSDLHTLIQLTRIIIWDEAPMQHRHGIEAVDRTLQDLLGNNASFGGITILFGGDFRQILPVVPRGSREQIINASLKQSTLWTQMQIYNLNQNMRLDQTPENIAFANWLLEVGAGNGLGPDKTFDLPVMMCLPDNSLHSLIDFIYPNIAAGHKPDDYFLNRAILSSKNDDVHDINHAILDIFPGDPTVLTSTDQALDNENLFPLEFLNTINVGGLPLAHLTLKPGCPVMLLRNLDPENGLCNGTRMIIVNIRPRILECRILGGSHAGQTVFIPRITLQPSTEECPIPFSRRQFPIRLAFAMTINKAQGQSVQYIGLDLRIPVFSHGQLYVALSRCTSATNIKVLFPPDHRGTMTTNIVYPEVLS